MPNEYSVEIHKFLSEKINETASKKEETRDCSSYIKGRLMELQWLREYLGKHIDLKDYTYY